MRSTRHGADTRRCAGGTMSRGCDARGPTGGGRGREGAHAAAAPAHHCHALCDTCHQAAAGMALSALTTRQRRRAVARRHKHRSPPATAPQRLQGCETVKRPTQPRSQPVSGDGGSGGGAPASASHKRCLAWRPSCASHRHKSEHHIAKSDGVRRALSRRRSERARAHLPTDRTTAVALCTGTRAVLQPLPHARHATA